MKKFFLVLVIALGFASNSNAQLVTYEIGVDGYSNGLTIQSPFYVGVESASALVSNGVLNIQAILYTSTTVNGSIKVKNDSINDIIYYPTTVAEIDTLNLDGLIKYFIKNDLDNKFGSENVTKVE
ncbi:MAG: hypothetical protein KC589_09200 [Nanoarchaeota archaeon]|nr:hypothetical protein [Nanoarchaeota archaeon]